MADVTIGNMVLRRIRETPHTVAVSSWSGSAWVDTTWGALRSAGATVDEALADEVPVKLFAFDLEGGKELQVGRHNFFVITEYNHSPLYARAVYELSERLKADYSAGR